MGAAVVSVDGVGVTFDRFGKSVGVLHDHFDADGIGVVGGGADHMNRLMEWFFQAIGVGQQ